MSDQSAPAAVSAPAADSNQAPPPEAMAGLEWGGVPLFVFCAERVAAWLKLRAGIGAPDLQSSFAVMDPAAWPDALRILWLCSRPLGEAVAKREPQDREKEITAWAAEVAPPALHPAAYLVASWLLYSSPTGSAAMENRSACGLPLIADSAPETRQWETLPAPTSGLPVGMFFVACHRTKAFGVVMNAPACSQAAAIADPGRPWRGTVWLVRAGRE